MTLALPREINAAPGVSNSFSLGGDRDCYFPFRKFKRPAIDATAMIAVCMLAIHDSSQQNGLSNIKGAKEVPRIPFSPRLKDLVTQVEILSIIETLTSHCTHSQRMFWRDILVSFYKRSATPNFTRSLSKSS